MSQKTNKIIVLVGVISLSIFTIWLSKNYIFTKIPKKTDEFKFTISFIIKGRDPDTGKRDIYIPIEGVKITPKTGKGDKIFELESKITDKEGKVTFHLEKRKGYAFFASPLSLLSSFYNYNLEFPYVIQLSHNLDIEGEIVIEKKLDLLPEVIRDIQRRNDLLVIKEALEEYKNKLRRYPLAIFDIFTEKSTTYQRLKPYLKDPNIKPFDPFPLRGLNYEYYSDENGSYFKLIAYPEKDFRKELTILSNYNGKSVYLISSNNN